MRKLIPLLLLVLSYEVQAQSPYLVRDINTTLSTDVASSTPGNFTAFGNRTYFIATTKQTGAEIWSTDGTSSGTGLLLDIIPGEAGSSPSSLTVVNGEMLFNASSVDHGVELWASDGTAAGTRRLIDINPGPSSSQPGARIVFGNRLLFSADDGTSGRELWITDGTAGGTQRLKDLNPGPAGSVPSHMTSFRGNVYFAAGGALWKTDGTEAGTVTVAAVTVRNLVVAGSQLFFEGATAASGWEPWVSDGSEGGTRMITEIVAGSKGGLATNYSALGGKALGSRWIFAASDDVHGRELWISDGTAAGTRMLRDIVPGPRGAWDASYTYLTAFGDRAWFNAADAEHGEELWSTDGTEQGTAMLLDLVPGSKSSYPRNQVVLGGTMYFNAYVAGDVDGLWATDGTPGGTRVITPAGAPVVGLRSPAVIGDRIWFSGRTSINGEEPWVTDGTDAGTRLVANLARDVTPSASPFDLTATNGLLFFYAREGLISPTSNIAEYSLWRSDGTAGGTYKLREIGQHTTNLIGSSSLAFFRGHPNAPVGFVTDGTVAGTTTIDPFARRFGAAAEVEDLFPAGDKLFARVKESDFSDTTMWLTTGEPNAPATRLGGPSPSRLFEFAGRHFFTTSTYRPALWTTDGTAEGTYEIIPEVGGGALLTTAGGLLFFATEGESGVYTLWKNDGTVDGSVAIRNVYRVIQMKGAGRKLFYLADRVVWDRVLWVTDGTDAGTVELMDFDLMPLESGDDLLPVGDGIVFQQYLDEAGKVTCTLWSSDGTKEGTRILNQAPWYLSPVLIDGLVYFAGYDAVHGAELWVTDGTPQGTRMLADINPGPDGSQPTGFTRVGDTIYFTAYTDSTGAELWALPLTGGGLSIGDARATEGGIVRFTVSLSVASAGNVSLSWATQDGTARAGEDYDAATGTLTFAPGETRKTIDVRLRGDAVLENNETFFVALSNPAGASIIDVEGAGLIEDDDRESDLSIAVVYTETGFELDSHTLVSNLGPSTATDLEVQVTSVPAYGRTGCTRCGISQLKPGQSAHTAFDSSAPQPSQIYFSAFVKGRQLDPRPANNATSWTQGVYSAMVMTPAFLTPGMTGSILAVVGSQAVIATSSDPSVVAVSSAVTQTDRRAAFTVTALKAGTSILSISGQPRTLLVTVVAAGTSPRFANAVNFDRNVGSPRVDLPVTMIVTPSGQAPFTGARATGTVTVTAGGVELARHTLNGNAEPLRFPIYFRAAGPVTYTIAYSGDANFLPQTESYSHSVAPGRVSITGGLKPVSPGTFRLRVEVEGSPVVAPTGIISVVNGVSELARVPLQPMAGSGKSFIEVTLTNQPASPSITINYAGDSLYSPASQQMRIIASRRRSARH